jgi:hypothetical protein
MSGAAEARGGEEVQAAAQGEQGFLSGKLGVRLAFGAPCPAEASATKYAAKKGALSCTRASESRVLPWRSISRMERLSRSGKCVVVEYHERSGHDGEGRHGKREKRPHQRAALLEQVHAHAS